MTEVFGVGVIGCGNISTTYFTLSRLFDGIEMRACADLNMDAANAQADAFGLRALKLDDMLKADDIDIVVNLTIPNAHFDISKQVLSADKHVYSEKPVVLSVDDGKTLAKMAGNRGLCAGSAPDTFLGGAHQNARRIVDRGDIGTVTTGTCHLMSHGMEHWHPNPDFFFKPGAGPVLDIGPYYIANLINLIGPIKRVAALTSMASKTRLITSEPRNGETISVETPTTIHGLVEFESGATVTLGASWDVWAHRHANLELYGTEGALYVPDPNFFGGDVQLTNRDSDAAAADDWDHPFAIPNQLHGTNKLANYRTAGLADMAAAIRDGRDARCSLDRAVHAVDVMTGLLRSGKEGQFVEMTTTCTRPEALGPDAATSLLDTSGKSKGEIPAT